MRLLGTAEEKFWQSIHKSDSGCWVWTESYNGRGRPVIYSSAKEVRNGERHQWLSHRWAYQHFRAPIQSEELVCHTCDNIKCVNPDHLFTGTQDDNMKDMVSKGRSNHPVGEENGRAILTEEAVRDIRANCKKWSKTHGAFVYAKKYGVGSGTILDALKGIKWGHII